MSFSLTSKDYLAYMAEVAVVIKDNKDYITELDAITGDGDHWVNINMGFEKILATRETLEVLEIGECLKKIGMLMMSGIGGSSGVLYGGAYLAASKYLASAEVLDYVGLCKMYEAMVKSMMERGNSEPGFKTMIDSLFPAVEAFKKGIAEGLDEKDVLASVKEASIAGANSTKDMEAIRGRACYQANKGVGHLDPGAVTMSYQISGLIDYILNTKY